MKSDDVQVGQVLRYDFFWKDQEQEGVERGKDRPCAVVITERDDVRGGKRVLVCPITPHTAG